MDPQAAAARPLEPRAGKGGRGACEGGRDPARAPAAMAAYAGQLAGLSAFCKEEGGGGRGEPPFVLRAETWLARHLQRRGVAARPARLPAYILRASGERSPT